MTDQNSAIKWMFMDDLHLYLDLRTDLIGDCQLCSQDYQFFGADIPFCAGEDP
jgi:hypothetical protein